MAISSLLKANPLALFSLIRSPSTHKFTTLKPVIVSFADKVNERKFFFASSTSSPLKSNNNVATNNGEDHANNWGCLPKKRVWATIIEAVRNTAIPTCHTVGIVLFMLIVSMCNCNLALARSGGRAGGCSSGRSRARSSRTSHTRSAISSYNKDDSSVSEHPVITVLCLFWYFGYLFAYLVAIYDITCRQGTCVLKLQVGSLATGQGQLIQEDINRITESADTSSSDGWIYILKETTKLLLHHSNFCISAYSSMELKDTIEDGLERLKQLSDAEQHRYDEETFLNVNGVKKKCIASQRTDSVSDGYIVVTILVVALVKIELPSINSIDNLKKALQELQSIPSNVMQGVLVLWTPQQLGDILTEKELQKHYSILRPFRDDYTSTMQGKHGDESSPPDQLDKGMRLQGGSSHEPERKHVYETVAAQLSDLGVTVSRSSFTQTSWRGLYTRQEISAMLDEKVAEYQKGELTRFHAYLVEKGLVPASDLSLPSDSIA